MCTISYFSDIYGPPRHTLRGPWAPRLRACNLGLCYIMRLNKWNKDPPLFAILSVMHDLSVVTINQCRLSNLGLTLSNFSAFI
jgi:hypothetical protein